MPSRVRIPGSAAAVAAVLAVAGCTSTAGPANGASGGPARTVTVAAGDRTCQLSSSTAQAGTITFAIANTGSRVTEFYLYAVGDRIVGEVENIGPGLTRQLIVEVPDGGGYTTACKPGMIGDGIRAAFTVTGSAPRAVNDDAELAEATSSYTRYITAQVDALATTTLDFAAAVERGDVEGAKARFPIARTYYERAEPVASSFGDLDPRLDGREDDQRDPGVAWAGFHRLEKDLWVDGLKGDSGAVADQLVKDVADLASRIPRLRASTGVTRRPSDASTNVPAEPRPPPLYSTRSTRPHPTAVSRFTDHPLSAR